MKNVKKYLALALAAVLLVAGTFAATVAWMTADADAKKNVFTVGDISIELDEETAVEGEGGTVTETQDGAKYEGVMPGDRLVKKVSLTNTGDVPVYAAITVTVNNAGQINDAIDDYYEPLGYTTEQIQAVYDEVFENWGIRYDKYDAEGKHLGMRLTNQLPTNDVLLRVDSAKTTTDGNNYLYAYNNWLQSEAEAANSALATPSYGFKDWTKGSYNFGNETVGIPAMNDYEIRYTYFVYLENKGDTFVPFTALNAPAYFNNEQMKMFEGLNITVDAAAIQADNFANGQDAMNALYGIEVADVAQISVSNQDELKAAVAAGNTKIYLTAGEYDLNGIQKNGLTLIGIGDDVKVANTTKYASGKSIGAIWKAINLENVTLTNTVYTMAEGGAATFIDVNFAGGVRQGYGTSTVYTNCTFGANSEGYAFHYQTDAASEGGVITLTDCEFQGGKVHLGGKRTYEFTGCTFAAGTDFQVWSGITLTDCTVDGVEVTAANAATVFPNLDLAKVTFG